MAAIEVAVRDHFVNIGRGKIFVREWLPAIVKSNTPIILIHDSLGCVELWRKFPALLARMTSRRAIAYDRLGFGHSDARLEPLTVNFITEESELSITAILDEFQLKSFVIFGHSVGGAMAVVCARKYGVFCEAVITESAQAFIEDKTLEAIAVAKVEFQETNQMERLRKYHGQKADWVLHAWTDTWLSQDFECWSLKNDLPRVKCPLLAIYGDRDEFGSIRHLEMICKLSGGISEKYIFPDCGHIPHREKTEIVVDLVNNFLEQHLPAS